MPIQLNVPQISGRVIAEVETRPARVEQWLSALPLLNIAETARKVLSQLSLYNRMAIEPQNRFEVAELYRYTTNQLTLELQKQYIGLPLPLPDKSKGVAEHARQMQLEMAFAYKWVVLDLAKLGDAEAKLKHARTLSVAAQRAVHYLTEAIVISYESYSPPPIGHWQEIHALYRYADSLGLAETEVDDICNRATQKSSVASAYKQALLLDVSDPYHLNARQVDKIYQYLDRWAHLATILPAQVNFDPTCQFLIDLTADRSGVLYTPDTLLEDPRRFRLLNTVELARKLHQQWTAVARGQAPPGEGLPEGFFSDAQDLLKRLISVWGLHPKRVFRRNARLDQEVDVAVGIDAVNYWLNGGVKFVVSSAFVGPTPQRTHVGPRETRSIEVRSEDLEYARWSVIEESAGGLSLAKRGVIKTRVRVGDLLGLRTPGEGTAWTVASVRWLRSANPSSVEVGAQRLTPSAEAVVIKTLNEKNQESDFMPALLLPEIRALNIPPTLLVPCGIFRPDRTLYLDNGYRLNRIVATKLLEATSAYERLEFRPAGD